MKDRAWEIFENFVGLIAPIVVVMGLVVLVVVEALR